MPASMNATDGSVPFLASCTNCVFQLLVSHVLARRKAGSKSGKYRRDRFHRSTSTRRFNGIEILEDDFFAVMLPVGG